MDSFTKSGCLPAALALGFALFAHDAAATSISRCTTADGATAYTDGHCSALGAQAAPMPLSLVRSLAQADGARSEESSPGFALAPSNPGSYASGSGRAPAFAGCPRTAGQLQAAFEQSLASGDVNRLAAVYDWTNVSGRQSRDLLQRLERMSHSRPQDVSLAGSVRSRAGCLLLSL